MNIEDYSIVLMTSTDITGVLTFLAVVYGNFNSRSEHKEPYYKRKDKRQWRY